MIDLGAGAPPAAAPGASAGTPTAGPPATDDTVRRALAATVVAAGLEPVMGDGAEDALAGLSVDRDAAPLAAAMAEAGQAFGALKCQEASAAAARAIEIAAGRQAAGLAVPELPRAWAYVLLCADRAGDTDRAMTAAARLRALDATGAVDAAVLARYPEVDAIVDREVLPIDIVTVKPGAAVWIDFRPAGTTPLHLALTAGPHLIAAAHGSERGVMTGTVVHKQPTITIPMIDEAGPWAAVAARVASWHGRVPDASELGWVLGKVHARVALVRHGDVVEAWGRAGRSVPPHRLGDGDDGVRALDDARGAVALIADRVAAWNDHAPDPDQPLLVEDIHARAKRLAKERRDEPTKWWVYAAIGAAVLAGGIAVYAHDHAGDTQHVELHFP